jgi:hypothetical protein
MSMSDVTLERLENAITMTAYVMRRHRLPQLLTTLQRLEAARDDLLVNGDPLEYAKRVLERGTIEVQSRINVAWLPDCKTAPNRPSACAAS